MATSIIQGKRTLSRIGTRLLVRAPGPCQTTFLLGFALDGVRAVRGAEVIAVLNTPAAAAGGLAGVLSTASIAAFSTGTV